MKSWGARGHDRLYALILLGLSLLYGLGGRLMEVGFYNGSVGPHHWIYMVSGVLSALSLWLLVQPTDFVPEPETWVEWQKRIPLALAILFYSQVLPYVGFLVAMISVMTLVSWLFGATWKQALLCAVILSLLCLLLFDNLLGISLGRGLWMK